MIAGGTWRAIAVALVGAMMMGCATTRPPGGPPQLDQPITLETADGTIHGSLNLPGGASPVPVALIIAGSGPTTRDGNVQGMPGNDAYRLLAEALAEQGIASVRYDKRGIGESAAAADSEADLRFEHYVEDAASWIRMLDRDPRFSRVVVVGHSEGSLIGMIAAQEAGADAFVSVAGVAQNPADLLRDQLSAALPAPLMTQSEEILTELEAGRTVEEVPGELFVIFRPSVQPYLISWFHYQPTEEIARLDMPVLIVQGTTDVQVPVAEAEALAEAAPDARVEIIEGMNHVLKRASGSAAEQQTSYFDSSLPVVPELVAAITEFVHEHAQ